MAAFFFFNDTATTEIYTLSLHDALPIYRLGCRHHRSVRRRCRLPRPRDRGLSATGGGANRGDPQSTRLNSSHQIISYAVFCLQKKNRGRERASPVAIVAAAGGGHARHPA